jgi:quercetin dioxygenase-like cupin family protein
MGRMQRSFVPKSPEGWEGVEREGYVPGDVTKVVRHTLVGGRKESADEPGPGFEVRYFEVPPGAVTRLEKHEHEHYVIVGAGVGQKPCARSGSTTWFTSARSSRISS